MQPLKISIITVCYNAVQTIERCIKSVINQNYPNVEYIVVDGGSTDGTLVILNKYQAQISTLISEPDKGLYDAMNKGIALATGEVVGILNADDFFTNNTIINSIAQAFQISRADILYGDLDFVNADGKVVRKWRSGLYKHGKFEWGWMPPHPSFYAKKTLFEKNGMYRLDYGSAADYELMLRFMHNHLVNIYYLKEKILCMQTGGISNKSLNSRVKAYVNDLKAMRENGIKLPLLTLILKPLRKIFQYF